LEIKNHRLTSATWIPSPNFDDRPEGTQPELIVVHGISLPPKVYGGEGITQLFTNRLNPAEHPYYAQIADLKVSSHLLIRRDGEVIQYVDFNQRAWHAGLSEWRGRERCNDFSIGIELEGDDETPYRAEQYLALSAIIRALQSHYQMPAEAVAGHCDISPGRKTDPGPYFNWHALQRLEREGNA
jgi:AmpD protein